MSEKIKAIHETDEEYGRRVSAILAKENTCENRIDAALESRAEDFIEIYRMADWDSLNEYGLALDKVAPDDDGPYIRYQISWGGPSEEIRFYNHKIEFVYMDWFDIARRDISNLEWAQWLKEYFRSNALSIFEGNDNRC